MTPTKEDVKKWMKKAGLTRDWLAEKCFVKRSAVNSWLSTDRGIPAAKLALIEKLMEGNEDISLNLPDQFEAMLREKAEAAKKDINDYVLNILEDFVRDVLKATKLKQNRYEDEKISDIQKINPVEPLPAASFLDQPVPVIGNIAAGALTPGDNIPIILKQNALLASGNTSYKWRENLWSLSFLTALWWSCASTPSLPSPRLELS